MNSSRARGLKLRLKGLGAWRGAQTTRWLIIAAAAPRGAREGILDSGCWGAGLGLMPNRRAKNPARITRECRTARKRSLQWHAS